jgi:hypothetical protein
MAPSRSPVSRSPLAIGAACELYSEADYSFNAKGLDSQAAEPDSPAPISGKDIRTVAKSPGAYRHQRTATCYLAVTQIELVHNDRG